MVEKVDNNRNWWGVHGEHPSFPFTILCYICCLTVLSVSLLWIIHTVHVCVGFVSLDKALMCLLQPSVFIILMVVCLKIICDCIKCWSLL